ncbi:MAG: CRISPR-associated endonuclease Cas2 [Rhodospirillaceae bacterium]
MPEGWRLMWVMVFYDLPTTSLDDRRAAVRFHKFLLGDGFERLHFSVYHRFCGSMERAVTYERRVEAALPERGYVCLLKLTDRQMGGMRTWIKGGYRSETDAEFAGPEQYLLL